MFWLPLAQEPHPLAAARLGMALEVDRIGGPARDLTHVGAELLDHARRSLDHPLVMISLAMVTQLAIAMKVQHRTVSGPNWLQLVLVPTKIER